MSELRVGGFLPFTTIDFPGELAAVVFCQGCPWRCRYCQNGDLLSRNSEHETSWTEVMNQLQHRVGLLDAVVFSGGEPTMQVGLTSAINQLRGLGFKIGLHTAGCYPERLEKVLQIVDWVGLDIKTLPEEYQNITTIPDSGERAWTSLQLLLNSGVAYEVRITVHELLTPPESLRQLLTKLSEKNVRHLVLQTCQWQTALDVDLGPCTIDWMEWARQFSDMFDVLSVRTGADGELQL